MMGEDVGRLQQRRSVVRPVFKRRTRDAARYILRCIPPVAPVIALSQAYGVLSRRGLFCHRRRYHFPVRYDDEWGTTAVLSVRWHGMRLLGLSLDLRQSRGLYRCVAAAFFIPCNGVVSAMDWPSADDRLAPFWKIMGSVERKKPQNRKKSRIFFKKGLETRRGAVV